MHLPTEQVVMKTSNLCRPKLIFCIQTWTCSSSLSLLRIWNKTSLILKLTRRSILGKMLTNRILRHLIYCREVTLPEWVLQIELLSSPPLLLNITKLIQMLTSRAKLRWKIIAHRSKEPWTQLLQKRKVSSQKLKKRSKMESQINSSSRRSDLILLSKAKLQPKSKFRASKLKTWAQL